MDEFAKNEPDIEATQLLEEILPVLQDYFEGLIYFNGKVINYLLPNGQNFVIRAKAT